jgi:hypothetical protein
MSISDMFPTREIINEKKGRRFAAGVCLNCGFKPCCCAIPKWVARLKLPDGLRRFKKRPKGVLPK